MAEALGLGTALWSPLGGGFLTGKYRSSSEGRINSRLAVLVHTEKTERETAILDTVLAVAKEIGAAPTEIAIAWLLHKAAKSTTSLIPILGSRTREQLDATLGALEVKLSSEQVARLDAVSAIPLGTRTNRSPVLHLLWRAANRSCWRYRSYRPRRRRSKKPYDRRTYVEDASRASHSSEWAA